MIKNIEKISVAILEPVGGHGGMDYYDFGLCRGLLGAGCEVYLYTCDATADPEITGLQFHPVYRRIFGPGGMARRAMRFAVGTAAALRAIKSRADIIHLHVFHGAPTELVLILLAKITGKKVVVTVHDVESFSVSLLGNRTVGAVYGLADIIIVHNAISNSEVVRKLHIDPKKVRVIPHGNYLQAIAELPDVAASRRMLRIPDSGKVVLFFGQIKHVKGLDLLLEAFAEVVGSLSGVTLLIAGRPWKSDFKPYEDMVDRLNLREHCVAHIRFIPDADVSHYYAAADVVVLPYRRIYQSGVVLLTMSYAKPVLVSDLPGMTEIVRDGENGFVFASGSKQNLASRLMAVLRDDDSRARVAAKGFEYVCREHDWSRIGQMTAGVYKRLLE